MANKKKTESINVSNLIDKALERLTPEDKEKIDKQIEYLCNMSKLQSEMWNAIMRAQDNQEDENLFDIDYSKAAAEVAKGYIEKAWFESTSANGNNREDFEEWLKENGIS